MSLPSNVGFGTVVGQFLVIEPDSADPGQDPEASAASGTVTFTATPTKFKNIGATPNPVTLLPQPVICTLDANGYIVDGQGAQGVKLVATDDPDLDPINWTWTATFDILGFAIEQVSFVLPENTTVDLTSVLPSDGSDGVNAAVQQDAQGSVQTVTKLTQAEYDALPSTDPFTLYVIVN